MVVMFYHLKTKDKLNYCKCYCYEYTVTSHVYGLITIGCIAIHRNLIFASFILQCFRNKVFNNSKQLF